MSLSPGFKTKAAQSVFSEVSANTAVFTKQGVSNNTYLLIGNVPSDNTGFPVRLANAEITYAAVQVSSSSTFDIQIFEWNGTNETLLLTINVVSGLSGDNTPLTPISITQNNQLRAKVVTGAATNPIVQVFFSGELVI